MNYVSYFPVLLLGVLMIVGSLIKLLGFREIDSDWFWFLTGCGLMVQGVVTFVRQKQFEKDYKVLKRKS
ncbi:MAG: putative membrane protein YfcA [Patescibacteria group bacterium]|jgi:uncharacterized membrane protein YfcA